MATETPSADTAALCSDSLQNPPLSREDFDCPLCHELLFEPCVPTCGHAFCKSCLQQLLQHSALQPQGAGAKCPVCRRVLNITRAQNVETCRQFNALLENAFTEDYLKRRQSQLELSQACQSLGSAETHKLPVFILDATLPRQHVILNVFEPRYLTMVRRAIEGGSRCFGMSWSESAGQGVEVEIVSAAEQWDGRYHLEVVGRRPFKITASAWAPEGFLEADIEYFDVEDGGSEGDGARDAARTLPGLVESWEKAVKEGGWERQSGHLSTVREHLGPMPDAEREPGALAAWVVALVNPLPALGVAPEMRPSLLRASSPLQRVEVAEHCLQASITYISSINNSMLAKALRLVPRGLRPFLPMIAVAVIGILANKLFSDA